MPSTTVTEPSAAAVALLVSDITNNPRNPRRFTNAAAFHDLVASIRTVGVLEPILVRPVPRVSTSYELVAGQRRLDAARELDLATIPAVVRDLTDDEAFELATVENVQRDDMSPVDEASAYAELMKRWQNHGAVARRIGKTESHVYRRLKLLELEAPTVKALAEGRLSLGHAELLLRLTPAQRAKALDLHRGVVWRESPLFDEEWLPGKDDLRPLHELQAFIRHRSTFDPLSSDTRHFQPELAGALEEDKAEHVDGAGVLEVLAVSEDTLVRSKLGAKAGDKIPLPPSRWHEVKTETARCEFTQLAVVTHGGRPRTLEVCIKKSCRKHWPVDKKKARETVGGENKSTGRPQWEIDDERRKAEAEAWAADLALVGRQIGQHARSRAKFGAALVRMVCDDWKLGEIKKDFGVELTDKTAAAVLLLSEINTYNRVSCVSSCKAVKFDLAGALKKAKAAAHKQAIADAKRVLDHQKKGRK